MSDATRTAAQRAGDRLDGFLRPAMPWARLTILRRLVCAFAVIYVLVRLPYFAAVANQDPSRFAPVGVVRLLASPLPSAAGWPLALATVMLGIAFGVGRAPLVTGPLFFALLLWVTTYKSSWGKILHSENLVVLHVGILALAPHRPPNEAEGASSRDAGWAVRAMAIATVLTYFVAGVAKLRNGGSAWLSGEALASWLAFDTLRKVELGSLHSPLAPFVASHASLTLGLALFTMVVELGAPLALVSPRLGRVWAVLAWCFHAGILATMTIGFFYPLSFIAFLSVSWDSVSSLRDSVPPRFARDPPA